MKTMGFFLLLIYVLNFNALAAFSPDAQVVLDLSVEDSRVWETLLNNIENLRKDLGENTLIEVVTHGGGLSLLLVDANVQPERMKKLAAAGVQFMACENTMRKRNLTQKDLSSFVGVVPSGVGELVKKQQAGWSYLKISY